MGGTWIFKKMEVDMKVRAPSNIKLLFLATCLTHFDHPGIKRISSLGVIWGLPKSRYYFCAPKGRGENWGSVVY